MKILTALLFTGALFAQPQLPINQEELPSKEWKMAGSSASVRVWQHQSDPLLVGVLTGESEPGESSSGDTTIVHLFYWQWVRINGNDRPPVKLLRSKVTICPYMHGTIGGCDPVDGIKLAEIVFVKVKVLKTTHDLESDRSGLK